VFDTMDILMYVGAPDAVAFKAFWNLNSSWCKWY
jgi:hypothetical protein